MLTTPSTPHTLPYTHFKAWHKVKLNERKVWGFMEV